MKFVFDHTNLNVTNLEKSIDFYQKALGLKVERKIDGKDFTLAFLSDGETGYLIELTCLNDHPQKYELGENETHICFRAPDYEAAKKLHAEMGCICYENTDMGLYFIEDPDGYWFEIAPVR